MGHTVNGQMHQPVDEHRGADAAADHLDARIRRHAGHDTPTHRRQHLTPDVPAWDPPPRLHSCTDMSHAELTIVIDDRVPLEHCPCGRWRMVRQHGGKPSHWEGEKNSRRRAVR